MIYAFALSQRVVDVLNNILEENNLNGWMDLQEVISQATPRFYLAAVEKNLLHGCELKSGSGLGMRLGGKYVGFECSLCCMPLDKPRIEIGMLIITH